MTKRTTRAVWVVGLVCAAIAAGLVAWYAFDELDAPDIIAAYRPDHAYPPLQITYPFDQAVFPPEIAAPTVRWTDDASGADCWAVHVTFGDEGALSALVHDAAWTPSDAQWADIQRRSVEHDATVTVLGARRRGRARVLSAGRITLHTSTDPVGAPLFYREVNLPFEEAVTDPSHIRWRFGDIASQGAPPVVLEKLPVCGNCHSFSADGSVLGMDVDYANDKGSYAVLRVQREMTLDKDTIITWSDYKREDGEQTFGLLSQVSPDGRHVVSTVKDRSVFVPKPGLMFSQLFFPIKGILAVYSRESKTFRSLPGADDPAYVQSNPAWSPDGQTIVFTRSKVHRLEGIGGKVLLTPDECREFLKDGKTFLFDLYRIPFNNGQGGTPEPIPGASRNGTSNYFPKFSPDGKWIVFCRAKSFSLLQPDSALWIMPAEGGTPRRLRCNTDRMNSWHSWSPNSRWLVFSSKHNGPYTQMWLAHIDQQGRSSRPVVLDHMTAPDRAANIPEFVNTTPGAIARIGEAFLDALSFRRAGEEAMRSHDYKNAARLFGKSLELDPNNGSVHNNLAIALMATQQFDEAFVHLREAIRLQPDTAQAHLNIGSILMGRGQHHDAMPYLREAVRLQPRYVKAIVSLARNLIQLGHLDEGLTHYEAALRVRPNGTVILAELAEALLEAGRPADAIRHYRRRLALEPDSVRALTDLAFVLATADQATWRNGPEAVTLASRACDLTQPVKAGTLNVLAAAYAETGQFDKAVATSLKALALARAAGNHRLVRRTQALVELYRQRRPLRMGADPP